MSLRKNLRSLHKYVALVLIGLLIVQSLSGLALVYRDQLERIVLDKYPVNPLAESRFDVDAHLERIKSSFPGCRVERIEFSDNEMHAAVVYMRDDASGERRIVLLDPFVGDVLVEVAGISLFPFWLFDFHRQLTLGFPGELIIAAEGIGLLFMLSSGLILWWPTRSAIHRQFDFRRSGLVAKLNMHRLTGIIGLPAMLAIGFTGTVLAVKIAMGGASEPASSVPKTRSVPLTAEVIKIINERQTAVRDIRLPVNGETLIINFEANSVIRPLASDSVQLSRQSGNVVALQEASDINGFAEVYAWMYPVHSGKFAGSIGTVFATFSGIFLLTLTVMGLLLYIERRKLVPKKTLMKSRIHVQKSQ